MMNRRNIILAAIFALVLVVAIAFSFGLFSMKPPLTVHLRCDEGVSGKLSVAMISPNGESAKAKSFDLKTFCKTGEIELSDYQREKDLRFIFERGDGQTFNLSSEYGRDIQSDQNGFHLILKITDTPPFISNDRL